MAKTINGEARIHVRVDDDVIYKKVDDSLVRAATTVSSLEAEKDNGKIDRTQSKATPNESSSQGTNSGGGPRCQEAMKDTFAQTRFKNESKHSNDSLLVKEPIKHKKKDQIRINKEASLKLQAELQAEFDEEQRFAREKAKKVLEANIALIETWDDVHRAGEKLIQKRAKKQKVDDDKEIAELKELMAIIPDKEEVAINAIPLAVKSLGIVDWKIYKVEKKSYY
nr:hypothetical protein [Tanacetum cinerariifolium]